ncbi:hypothetical protein [Stenotrophomonas humi]
MESTHGFRSRLALFVVVGIMVLIGVKFPTGPLALGLVVGVISFLVDLLLLKKKVGDGWTIWIAYIGLGLLIIANTFFESGDALHRKLSVMGGCGISWSVCWILARATLKQVDKEETSDS